MEFQSAFERNLETIPAGELGIIALKSCEALGEKINAHIVQWRQGAGARAPQQPSAPARMPGTPIW